MHYVGFEGKLCQKLMAGLGLGQSGLYSMARPELLLEHLRRLEGLLLQASPDSTLQCSKELYALLLDFSQSLTPLPDSRYTEAAGMEKEMILYLEDHYGEDISLDDLAGQFRRTPEYLCSIFKAATGETISHYLRRVRIHRSGRTRRCGRSRRPAASAVSAISARSSGRPPASLPRAIAWAQGRRSPESSERRGESRAASPSFPYAKSPRRDILWIRG